MIDLTFEKETLDPLSTTGKFSPGTKLCDSLTEKGLVAVTLTNTSERWAKGTLKYYLMAPSALIPRDLACGTAGSVFLLPYSPSALELRQ